MRFRPTRIPYRRIVRIALVVALLLLACGATPYFLTVAPAGTLVIDVSVAEQWGNVASGPDVTLQVRITDRTHGFIAFRGGQSFVCDGVLGPTPSPSVPRLDVGELTVPRQPSGGAYRCVYTDERGRRTTLAVAVPTGALAITSPRPGARVPTPYANPPEPRSTGEVAPLTPAASVLPQPTATLIPTAVPPNIGYTLPALPLGARGTTSGEADGGGVDGGGYFFRVLGTEQPLTGAYTFVGPGTTTIGGYFMAGPVAGRMVLSTTIALDVAGTGFAAVQVTDVDHLQVPITWIPAS